MTRPTQGTLQRQKAFAYGSVTLYGRPFQIVLLADCLITPVEGPTTPKWKPLRFGLFPVRSPLLRKSIFLSFPADTEMFQFSAFATRALCIQTRSVRESRDHHLFDGYPGLIAVFRALQSLLMPRHPPCALSSLTTRIECSQHNKTTDDQRPKANELHSKQNASRFNYSPPDHCQQARQLPGVVTYLFSLRTRDDAKKLQRVTLEPWENAASTPSKDGTHGIHSRCQLPRPNCQRTKQADRNKTDDPTREPPASRPAHDLLRQSLPWTEVRREKKDLSLFPRTGPQPMISVPNPSQPQG